MLARANCRLGKIPGGYSKLVKNGLFLSQKPKPGTVLPKFGKVHVRVSRGPGLSGATNPHPRAPLAGGYALPA